MEERFFQSDVKTKEEVGKELRVGQNINNSRIKISVVSKISIAITLGGNTPSSAGIKTERNQRRTGPNTSYEGTVKRKLDGEISISE